jgi:retron-type reverse transcriptase
MPKRHGNLYQQLTIDRLYLAYQRSRAGKRTLPSTQLFERDLGANITTLHRELHDGSYQIQPYRIFQVHEPKTRDISAPAFRDRIVQHAIYDIIYRIFDRTFIHDSYGCRIGKGTHKAADQVQRYLRDSHPQSYTLQIDIRKFYYSIHRGILRTLIERKIKDPRLIDLMMRFAHQADPCGLPIGNLLSQLYALIYLNPFDHWIKRDLKIARYVRYVDDAIVFNLGRNQARELRDQIAAWLHANLALTLSRHTIATNHRGVNFCGFRTARRYRLVRKHSLYRFSRSLARADTQSLNAIMGHALRTATITHFRRRITTERPSLAPHLAHMPKPKKTQVHP